jgi:hypothetical protein
MKTVTLPSIVRIVLTQAAQHRMHGQITQKIFDSQVERIWREELEPHDLSVVVRELPWGTTRFIIKAMTSGQVCDLIEIGPDGVPIESAGASKDLHG